MSIWDKVRSTIVNGSCLRGPVDPFSTYSICLFSNPSTTWSMLLPGIGGSHVKRDISDLYDLAMFVEDFVLCDQIGVCPHVLHALGPYLIEGFANTNDFPLFNSAPHLDAIVDQEKARISQGLVALSEDSKSAISNEMQQAESQIIQDMRRLEAELNSAAETNASQLSQKELEHLLHRIEELSSDFKELANKERELLERQRLLIMERHEFLSAEVLELRQEEIELIKAELAASKDPNSLLETFDSDNFNNAYSKLASLAACHGICLTPGYSIRDFFLANGMISSLPRKVVAELKAVHFDQLQLLEKWSQPRPYEIPPMLSILLNRAGSKSRLIPELCSLREQYAPLRQAIREAKAVLNGKKTLAEKLEAARRLEAVRETVLKKAVQQPAKRWFRRTWGILKTGSIFGALVELADLVLEWDDNRRLLGGLYHFVELERLALEIKDDHVNVERHFGEIQKFSARRRNSTIKP